jgi:penicillin-binding protein 2
VASFRPNKRNRPVPRLEPRIAVLTALMAAAFTVVILRLYYLQVLQHKQLSELADRNRIRLQRLPAPRGLVFDRRHRALVDTRPTFDAVLVPEDTDNLSATIEKLEHYLGTTGVAQKVADAEEQGRPPYQPIMVFERLDWQQVVALEAHQLDLPGVSLEITPGRHYLYGTLASHLLGYVGEVNRQELMRSASYHMGDEIGKFGLEREWEQYLRGEAGGEEIEVDAVGRRLRVLKEIPDTPGDSVVLTLDLDVQQAAEQAMAGKDGALVAIDPNNGRILAMVSHPGFDPDVFGAGVSPAAWHTLVSDPKHPLEDRAIQGIYAPGSTFKIVDSIAGLEDGTLHPDTVYYCPGGLWFGGRVYHCWRKQGHGSIALHDAIVRSCDVYFYHVGETLGIDRIARWANRLGLGAKTGIDLDNERTGIIPSSAWKMHRFHQRWYPAETLSVAIGQGYVAVTPIQLAQLAEMVANGGIRYQPQYVREVEGLDGAALKTYAPVIASRANISPDILQFVRDAMCDVVNSPRGTAHKAALPNVTVCGKTGTAQIVGEKTGIVSDEHHLNETPYQFRDNAVFMAFAPKEHPQIAIGCIVEHGGHGGSAAAPVVHDVLQRYFQLYPPAPEQPQVSRAGAAAPRPMIARVLDSSGGGASADSAEQ